MKDGAANDARFMGKVTSGVTHDLQNILAIIRESAGLMEDLLLIHKDLEIPFLDKLQKSLKGIQAQTQRGAQLVSTLNNFAHSPDVPVTDIDMAEITESLTLLIKRKIEGLSVVIDVEKKDPVHLKTNVLKFQTAVLSSVECLLEQFKKAFTITVSFESSEKGGKVILQCNGDNLSLSGISESLKTSEKYSELETLCSSLNGQVAVDEKICALCLTFSPLA